MANTLVIAIYTDSHHSSNITERRYTAPKHLSSPSIACQPPNGGNGGQTQGVDLYADFKPRLPHSTPLPQLSQKAIPQVQEYHCRMLTTIPMLE